MSGEGAVGSGAGTLGSGAGTEESGGVIRVSGGVIRCLEQGQWALARGRGSGAGSLGSGAGTEESGGVIRGSGVGTEESVSSLLPFQNTCMLGRAKHARVWGNRE